MKKYFSLPIESRFPWDTEKLDCMCSFSSLLTTDDMTAIRECLPGGTAKPRSLTMGISSGGCKNTL